MTHEAVKSLFADYQIICSAASDFLGKAEQAADRSAERELFLGMAAYEMKSYELAYEHLRESQRRSSSADTAARLALCRWRQVEFDDAIAWINVALEANPNGTVKAPCIGTETSFISVKAAIELESGNIEEALHHATEALRRSDRDALAQITIANALLSKGDHQESKRALDAVAQHAPPYLRRQVDALRSIVQQFMEANAGGRPIIMEFSALALRKAI